jgi:hypothetical protein
LGYNQAQLNLLGFTKDLGAYFGIVAGLAINEIAIWGFLSLAPSKVLWAMVCSGWFSVAEFHHHYTGWQARKKERKKVERNCSDICCAAAAAAAAAMSLLVFVLDLSACRLIHQL